MTTNVHSLNIGKFSDMRLPFDLFFLANKINEVNTNL